MKNWPLLTLCVAFLAAVPSLYAFDEGEKQWSSTYTYHLPSGDFYDAGAGLDFKFGRWGNDDKMYVLTLGYMSWGIDGRIAGSGNEAAGASGDVTMIPIGVSMIMRNETDYNRNLDISLEFGVKYVLTDSDADAVALRRRADGTSEVLRSKVEVDDTIVALAALELDMLLNDYNDLTLSVGYNYDISAGDAKASGVTIGENELQGFYFGVGYAHRW